MTPENWAQIISGLIGIAIGLALAPLVVYLMNRWWNRNTD